MVHEVNVVKFVIKVVCKVPSTGTEIGSARQAVTGVTMALLEYVPLHHYYLYYYCYYY